MVVLLRLVLRPDRALGIAALGLAAAMLLPIVGSLVLAGLVVQAEEGWVAYAPAGEELDIGASAAKPTWVLAAARDGSDRHAYRVGPPVVQRGALLAMPEADPDLAPRSPTTLDGLPPDAVLVHPADLGPSRDVLAHYRTRPDLAGAIVAPARGADAFEASTTQRLREQSLLLVALSVPAVALVASAFARQEVHARRRQSATLSALGGHRAALAVLLARTTLTAALGGFLATALGFALYSWGPGLFRPDDAPRLFLAIAIVVPTTVAALAGAWWAWHARHGFDVLKTGDDEAAGDTPRLPLPWRARPLVLGLRPLGILLLAGALFCADVGFPLAAAQVPASLAGGDDEWVFGAEDGLVVGRGVDAGAARVALLDPAVTAVLAESVVPTLVEGHPAIVRGGDWSALASYHGLRIVEGRAPRDGLPTVALGTALARRLDVGVGDDVALQGGDRPDRVVADVAAIVDGPPLLDHEAFVAEGLGRRLAGLPEGRATLLHVRPATQEALAAVTKGPGEVVVVSLAVDPPAPAAASIAQALVEVANLGAQAGERSLTVRVAGDAVGTVRAVLPGHARQTLRVPFLVPSDPWVLEVNPGLGGDPAPAERSWEVPERAVAGTSFTATLLEAGRPVEGASVALHRDLAAAAEGRAQQEAVTDSQGRASFTAPAAGEWVVGARDTGGAASYAVVPVVRPDGGLVVDAVWTVPATVTLGTSMQLLARVRNDGVGNLTATVPAAAGTFRFDERQVTLAPGETRTLSFQLLLVDPVANVSVGGRNLRLGTAGSAAAPDGAGPGSPASGGQVQAEVADRALGDARAVLVGLASSAVVSTLAIVWLTTRRAVAGRRHVTGLLRVLGWDDARVAQRAAVEGACLGAAAALAALLPAKLAFRLLGAYGPPVFAHGLPDPVGWLFALQATAAFAGVCALAAYVATSRPSRA